MRKLIFVIALALMLPVYGQRTAPGRQASIRQYIEGIKFNTFHTDSIIVADSTHFVINNHIDMAGYYLIDAQNITDRTGTHLWFDGVDDTLTIGTDGKLLDVFDDNGGAIEILFRPRSDGSSDTAQIWNMSGSFLALTSESGGQMKARWVYDFSTTDGQWTTTNRDISTNDWNHIMVVYDADLTTNDPAIYVNGDTVYVTEDTTPVGTRGTDASAGVVIGSDGTTSTYVYDGDIALIRYWNLPPTADQVKSAYSGSAIGFASMGADNTLINDTSAATTQTDAVVIGKGYEWLGGNSDSLKYLDDGVETLISTSATTFVASEDTVKIYGDNTEADLYQIGVVLEYRGAGINDAENKWYSSGHDGLHAAMAEAVAVAELPGLYVNSWEPVANDKITSINKTVSASRTEIWVLDEDGDVVQTGDLTLSESGGMLDATGSQITLSGGNASGDDLILDANTNESYPLITLLGNSTIEAALPSGSGFVIDENGTNFITMDRTATTFESDATSAIAVHFDVDDVTSGDGVFIDSDANALAAGSALKVEVATTAANASKAIEVLTSGANATTTRTQYGVHSSATGSGTASTNVAGYFAASGASNNYAVQTSGDARVDGDLDFVGAQEISTTAGELTVNPTEGVTVSADSIQSTAVLFSLTSATPMAALTDTDVNTTLGSGAQIVDTSAIYIEADGTPALGIRGTDGDGYEITINTSDQALFENATDYVFDSEVGANSTTPYHSFGSSSSTPWIALTDSDVNTTVTSAAEVIDTNAIYMEADAEPSIGLRASDGDGYEIAINTSDQALFQNASGGYVFDDDIGANTSTPFHGFSDYSTAPDLTLTDTDVNTTVTSAGEAADTAAIYLEAADEPSINLAASDGDDVLITINTSDQMLLQGATGGYVFDDEVGVNSATPYHGFADYSATPDLTLTDTDVNTTITSSGEAADSSAIYMEANAEPSINLAASDGDDALITINTDDQLLFQGGTDYVFDSEVGANTTTPYHSFSSASATPWATLTDSDVNTTVTSAGEVIDTAAIYMEADGTPAFGIRGTDGDGYEITINTNDQALFENATDYVFDSEVGANSTTPYHSFGSSSSTPWIALTDSDVNTTVTSAAEVIDTNAIFIEADAEPSLGLRASDGDAYEITINTSDQAIFQNAAGGYVFDADLDITGDLDVDTLIVDEAIGIGSGYPQHDLTLYSATPWLAMTDTDVNTTISSAAEAIDTNAIYMEADAEPSIGLRASDGDAYEISINTSDQALFQSATSYVFDSVVGANTTTPYHSFASYSSTPWIVVTDSDVNTSVGSAAQAIDSNAIYFEADGTPSIGIVGPDGAADAYVVTINTDDQALFQNAGGGYLFDDEVGVVMTTTPYHSLSGYSATPWAVLTDTDVNTTVSSAAQAIDSNAIYFEADGSPSIGIIGPDGAADAYVIAINTDDQALFQSATGGYIFDDEVSGASALTPYHAFSSYGTAQWMAATDTDVNTTVTSAAEAIDTSAIFIEADGTPSLGLRMTDGDAFEITINTSDQALFENAAGGYVFDDDIGANTSTPYHGFSDYSTAPDLALTDTDVNTTVTSAGEAADTAAIYLEAADEPSINLAASDGDDALITINTSDQLLFQGGAGGYVFDDEIGANTSTPYHGFADYSATPDLTLTDTDVNTTVSSSGEAQDSSAIYMEADAEPTINLAASDGDDALITINTNDQLLFQGGTDYVFDNEIGANTTTPYHSFGSSSSTPWVALTDTDVNTTVNSAAEVIDTNAIFIEADATPSLGIRGADGDAYEMTINTSDQALFTNASGGYVFDDDMLVNTSNYVLEGYATGRNVVRSVVLSITGNTDETKATFQSTDNFNGEAFGAELLVSGATGTNFDFIDDNTVDILTTQEAVKVLSHTLETNDTGTAYRSYVTVSGGDVRIILYKLTGLNAAADMSNHGADFPNTKIVTVMVTYVTST